MAVQCFIRGNLGQNFNLRPVQSVERDEASMVLNFSVASPVFKRNHDGKMEVVDTEWIECEYWNRRASHFHKIFQKGMPVFLIGEERYETYVNKDGVEVRVRKVRAADVYLDLTERVEAISLRAPKRDHEPVPGQAQSGEYNSNYNPAHGEHFENQNHHPQHQTGQHPYQQESQNYSQGHHASQGQPHNPNSRQGDGQAQHQYNGHQGGHHNG